MNKINRLTLFFLGGCASAADACHSRRCTRAANPVVGRGDGRAGAKRTEPPNTQQFQKSTEIRQRPEGPNNSSFMVHLDPSPVRQRKKSFNTAFQYNIESPTSIHWDASQI